MNNERRRRPVTTNMADRVVSQELTEKIVQFQEVTGTEDMEEAWSQLESHGWDLVAAVQDHLAIKESHSGGGGGGAFAQNTASASSQNGTNTEEGDSGGGSGTDTATAPPPPLAPAAAEGVAGPSSSPSLSPSPPPPSPPGSSGTGRQATPQINRATTTTASNPRNVVVGYRSFRGGRREFFPWGLLGWGYYLVTLPLRLTLASLSSFVLFLYRIIYPYPRRLTDPLEDVLRFIREYEAEYGQQHPAFFQGSYSQALSHAKSELKFLLVYLHCADHQDTPLFCRTILSDPTLVEYINTSMVFWGCSVTSAEGYRVSQALRENSYPFLALVVLRDGRMTVVGRLEELIPAPQLTTRLQGLVRENEAHLVVARAERQERELTAALRLQQDEDYQMSLRADQEKERRKQAEREEAQRKEREEREKQEDQQREKDNIRRQKVEWVDRVPSEPEEGTEGVVHIVVKLPQGTRLERRFLKTDSLASLYYYIFCHPDSPDRFQVTTNFPRQVVPCEPSTATPVPPTFQEFRLPPRSMLFVSDLDA